MTQIPDYLTPEIWLANVFAAAEVRKGGVLKRKIRDVERLCGQDAFLNEARKRGFQVVRNARHFVVFCNSDPIRRVV